MIKNRGFTVLELLVVVVLLCIVLVIVVPAGKDLMARLQAWRISTELAQAAQQARAIAVSRAAAVTLCGSSSGHHCDGAWSKGLLLFADRNRNRQKEMDEELLHYSPIKTQDAVMAWSGFGVGSALLIEAAGAPYASNGSFTYCSRDGEPRYRRQVIVSRLGRVRISRDTNGDGIHESVTGGMIICP